MDIKEFTKTELAQRACESQPALRLCLRTAVRARNADINAVLASFAERIEQWKQFLLPRMSVNEKINFYFQFLCFLLLRRSFRKPQNVVNFPCISHPICCSFYVPSFLLLLLPLASRKMSKFQHVAVSFRYVPFVLLLVCVCVCWCDRIMQIGTKVNQFA